MIDWYTNYDEINVELREMAARSQAEMDEPESAEQRIFVGSGEDICTFQMERYYGK